MRSSSAKTILATAFAGLAVASAVAQQPTRFLCAPSKSPATQTLSAESLFPTHPSATSFGFDLVNPPGVAADACSSDKPFFFSATMPGGNYRVTVVLGGPSASITTIRAESRRLFVLEQHVASGKSTTVDFLVNLRRPEVAGTPATRVKLKPREIGALDWDEKLTLEFNGEHPAVRSITIAPAPTVPTLYLAGDSTVVDQDKEPWAAWGQMLPVFFNDKLATANNAESGETIKSFAGENRYAKIMSVIRPGDFLMIQFAHNDQKLGSNYVPAQTDYKDFLRRYIAGARDHGATPILVTSMNRRAFDAAGHITQTLGDYPEAMRQVALEQHVALIDLNAMSKPLFEAMGPTGTLKAFVHYPANTFPDQPEELKDDTHFNAYGAYELARCVVEAIRSQHLPVAPYLRPGIMTFDPAHPEAAADIHIPASPMVSTTTPYGR